MINLNVRFYDDHQQGKLAKYDSFSEMEGYVTNGFVAPTEEILIYSCFTEQKDHDGFRTYSDLRRKMPSRRKALEDYFCFDGTSIRSVFKGRNDVGNDKTERIGVGIALSLASGLYDLTEADWEKVAEKTKNKTLDHRIASNGSKFIEVEAKGVIVDNVQLRSDLSDAKGKVLKKKGSQRGLSNQNDLIGIITAIPFNTSQIATCYLLDPPPFQIDYDPLKFKLLTRLSFYWRELSILSRCHFLEVLINRIRSIQRTSDYRLLDNMPLFNRRGEPHKVPESLVENRSSVLNGSAFGEVVPLNRDMFLFYGFEIDVINALIQQDFREITSLQFKTHIENDAKVLVKIPKWMLEYPPMERDDYREDDNESRKTLLMAGDLTHTSAGRVIGLVKQISD